MKIQAKILHVEHGKTRTGKPQFTVTAQSGSQVLQIPGYKNLIEKNTHKVFEQNINQEVLIDEINVENNNGNIRYSFGYEVKVIILNNNQAGKAAA